MRSLKESLLSNIEDTLNKGKNSIKEEIIQFLEDNYNIGYDKCRILEKRNKDGKYIVNCIGNVNANININKLTNDLFVFGIVTGSFSCSSCFKLQSLEGSPKEVKKNFYCNQCKSLTSLKGSPKKIGKHFCCMYCDNLSSFDCNTTVVDGDFNCVFCKNLISSKGMPKKINGYFVGGTNFSKEDILKYCEIKKENILI